VYDVGRQEDGTPFIVMEYVDGVSLAGLLKGGGLAPPRAVALMVQMAEAAHYAHKQGFVHRDLKPGNVLLDAEGNAHLADFGLAVHDSTQRQHAGEYAGSLAYMSPEQVRGETHRLDGRADIWSLGVILYQMLTERCPFAGDNLQEICDEILRRDPKPLRQIDDRIPAELERICLKCLAKPASDRYLTARDLARDLRAWDRPRRHDAMPLAMAVLALLLLFPAGYFLWRTTPPKQETLPTPQRPQSTPVPDANGTTSARPAASVRPVVTLRPTGEPLDGSLDLLVWSPWDASRRGLRMSQPRALPLRAADQVRIEAQLNRPAYVYLVWIDSEGSVSPVYPWTPGRWSERPSGELPARHLALPEKADEGWPMQPGAPGMETLLLLARQSPLEGTLDLNRLLSGLPRQSAQTSQALVWFVNGELITGSDDGLRAPKFFDPQRIDDPVLKTQRLIAERLKPHFELIRAVSFANRGE